MGIGIIGYGPLCTESSLSFPVFLSLHIRSLQKLCNMHSNMDFDFCICDDDGDVEDDNGDDWR